MLLPKIADNDLFNSFPDIRRLQRQLNRMPFGDSWPSTEEFPSVNVWTGEKGAVVQTEIPGVNPNDVEISLVNDTLTIKGISNSETLQDDAKCHRQERIRSQFIRSLKLPFGVEADRVEATFKNGVLDITLPRAESDKPRKIGVVSE